MKSGSSSPLERTCQYQCPSHLNAKRSRLWDLFSSPLQDAAHSAIFCGMQSKTEIFLPPVVQEANVLVLIRFGLQCKQKKPKLSFIVFFIPRKKKKKSNSARAENQLVAEYLMENTSSVYLQRENSIFRLNHELDKCQNLLYSFQNRGALGE